MHHKTGFLEMPFSNSGKSINTIVGNGKRLMAYELVERLKPQNKLLVLNELTQTLNNTEKKESKLHGVFETSFDWEECRTMNFIEQKLNYMHWNPCKGNKLVDVPEKYVHSSAKFYIIGVQGIYPVTSFMELEDIDLTRTL